MSRALPPIRPCGSCPYRRDVPSGIWHPDEYAKLPAYDGETFTQPAALFMCHQQDGRVCSGWAGCHDMGESLAVRMAGFHDPVLADALLDYVSPVALFASGEEAARHGMAEVLSPGERARRKMEALRRKRRAA